MLLRLCVSARQPSLASPPTRSLPRLQVQVVPPKKKVVDDYVIILACVLGGLLVLPLVAWVGRRAWLARQHRKVRRQLSRGGHWAVAGCCCFIAAVAAQLLSLPLLRPADGAAAKWCRGAAHAVVDATTRYPTCRSPIHSFPQARASAKRSLVGSGPSSAPAPGRGLAFSNPTFQPVPHADEDAASISSTGALSRASPLR